MTKFSYKTVYAVFGAYALYRYVSLQSEAADGTASMVDDIMSTLNTGISVITTATSDVRKYFVCVDPETGIDWTDLVVSSARKHGVPPILWAAQLKQESGYKASAYNRYSGCAGIAQFAVGTAADYGMSAADRYNPALAIPAGAKYMSYLHRRFGTWPLALAAYNWGMGNLERKGWANAPSETRNYVAVIYDKNRALIGA